MTIEVINAGTWVGFDENGVEEATKYMSLVNDMDRGDTVYRYKPWTIGAGVDKTMRLNIGQGTVTSEKYIVFFSLSDVVGDFVTQSSNSNWSLRTLLSGVTSFLLQIFESGVSVDFDQPSPQFTTPYDYYLELVIDADGGTGNGRITVLIYEDSNFSTLVDTLIADATAETLASFAAYAYIMAGFDDGNPGTGPTLGFSKNLDLDYVAPAGGGLLGGANLRGNMQ